MRSKLIVISMITLIIGLIGYFAFWNHWIRIIFAHIGALGIIGLFAMFAGIISVRKGLSDKKAILLGFFPPIIFGIIAVYLVDPPRKGVLPSSCGGILSLGLALTVVIIYLALKGRKE